MTSPDCVSAGLGIDVIEAEEVPNVRDLFEAIMATDDGWPESFFLKDSRGLYMDDTTANAYYNFRRGYRAAGGQGA